MGHASLAADDRCIKRYFEVISVCVIGCDGAVRGGRYLELQLILLVHVMMVHNYPRRGHHDHRLVLLRGRRRIGMEEVVVFYVFLTSSTIIKLCHSHISVDKRSSSCHGDTEGVLSVLFHAYICVVICLSHLLVLGS